ncbi:hypothetical protein ACIGNX_25515 [Actinosynnema sp. NPDC053489]
MAQENDTYFEAPSSGLLLGAQALTTAVDRRKANGAVADNDTGEDADQK